MTHGRSSFELAFRVNKLLNGVAYSMKLFDFVSQSNQILKYAHNYLL
uniref:Uncharacterized protein n=1 Tax=Ralstonia solanacearum TaxID=305 RepID=A0A0S4TMC6_RALSL|nr:protein of unknown function [Ralstonia solanacearum]